MASGLRMPSWSFSAARAGKLLRMNSVSMAPSMTTCATWTPCGPSSRAMLWARARSACLAPEKAEKPELPRTLDVALDGVDQRHHLLLLARVRAEGARPAALALDAGD